MPGIYWFFLILFFMFYTSIWWSFSIAKHVSFLLVFFLGHWDKTSDSCFLAIGCLTLSVFKPILLYWQWQFKKTYTSTFLANVGFEQVVTLHEWYQTLELAERQHFLNLVNPQPKYLTITYFWRNLSMGTRRLAWAFSGIILIQDPGIWLH